MLTMAISVLAKLTCKLFPTTCNELNITIGIYKGTICHNWVSFQFRGEVLEIAQHEAPCDTLLLGHIHFWLPTLAN